MSSMVTISGSGDFEKTYAFCKKMQKFDIKRLLDSYGRMGVAALSSATPVRSGKTAASWDYEIKAGQGSYAIYFVNNNVNHGVNIAIILDYGHGTRNGGYVQGRQFINSAIQPVFDKIAEDAWKEVTSA